MLHAPRMRRAMGLYLILGRQGRNPNRIIGPARLLACTPTPASVASASCGGASQKRAGGITTLHPRRSSQRKPASGCVRPFLTATFCSPMDGRMGHCLAGLVITICSVFNCRVILSLIELKMCSGTQTRDQQRPQHQSTATATIHGSEESTFRHCWSLKLQQNVLTTRSHNNNNNNNISQTF
jgi:hypothetical protein